MNGKQQLTEWGQQVWKQQRECLDFDPALDTTSPYWHITAPALGRPLHAPLSPPGNHVWLHLHKCTTHIHAYEHGKVQTKRLNVTMLLRTVEVVMPSDVAYSAQNRICIWEMHTAETKCTILWWWSLNNNPKTQLLTTFKIVKYRHTHKSHLLRHVLSLCY